MAQVSEWFNDFMPAHMRNFLFYPWPVLGSPEYDSLESLWQRAFVRNGMTIEVALEASARMAEEALPWEKHLPRLLEIGHEVFREMNASGALAEPNSLEAAKACSADCHDCGGQGVTTRYRHRPSGDGTGRNAPGFAMTCYCDCCAMGKLTARTHREKSPEVAARIADLSDAKWAFLRLREIGDGTWSNPRKFKPESWDAAADVPILSPVDYRQDIAARSCVVSVSEVLKRPTLQPHILPTPPDPVVVPVAEPDHEPTEVVCDSYYDEPIY